jgi:hypothetical protein
MPVSAFAEHDAPATLADRAVLFPLSVAPSESYLQDAAGGPFLIQGDAAWSLNAGLTREKAGLYLADGRACGSDTVLVNLIAVGAHAKDGAINGEGSKDWVLLLRSPA